MKPELLPEYQPWWRKVIRKAGSSDLAFLYAVLAFVLLSTVCVLVAGAWDSGRTDPHSVDACLYSRYAFGC